MQIVFLLLTLFQHTLPLYMLRVVVADVQALQRFIIECLAKIPGVGNLKSSFALKQVKYQTALPLPNQSAYSGLGA